MLELSRPPHLNPCAASPESVLPRALLAAPGPSAHLSTLERLVLAFGTLNR
jgi:hypothetical protein